MEEPTVNTGLHFLYTNVAVSKILHRLFFYPTKERVKRTEKYIFVSFLSKGVDYGRGLPFNSVKGIIFFELMTGCSL